MTNYVVLGGGEILDSAVCLTWRFHNLAFNRGNWDLELAHPTAKLPSFNDQTHFDCSN